MQKLSYNQRVLGVCYLTSFEFKGRKTKFRRQFSELIISGNYCRLSWYLCYAVIFFRSWIASEILLIVLVITLVCFSNSERFWASILSIFYCISSIDLSISPCNYQSLPCLFRHAFDDWECSIISVFRTLMSNAETWYFGWMELSNSCICSLKTSSCFHWRHDAYAFWRQRIVYKLNCHIVRIADHTV